MRRSCTGFRNTLRPVIWLSCGRSRAMTAGVLSVRCFKGLRFTNMNPPPARLPPEKPTTVSTAGSLRMISTAWRSLRARASDEMLWSALRPALSWPLSCSGKYPLGIFANKYTLSPITASRMSTTRPLLARAQSRLCPYPRSTPW